MRPALAIAWLSLLFACGSSESAPDALDAGTGAGSDVGPRAADAPADAPAGAPATEAGADTTAPGACGPRVSDEDCRRCGVPSAAMCAGGGPPAPACTTPPGNPFGCCGAGLGRYCGCVLGQWSTVICDPPPPDSGGQGPFDAASGADGRD